MPASDFLRGRFNLPPADTAAPRLKCNLCVLTGWLQLLAGVLCLLTSKEPSSTLLVVCAAPAGGLAEHNMVRRWYYRANYTALLVFALVAVHFRRPGALLAVLALLLGGSCLSDPLARKYRCATSILTRDTRPAWCKQR